MYKPIHAWFFLAPALILLLVFSIIPSFMALGLSFTDYNVFTTSQWVGLDNYARVLQDNNFWGALRNTVTYWLLVTPLLVVVPVFIAVLVNQKLFGMK